MKLANYENKTSNITIPYVHYAYRNFGTVQIVLKTVPYSTVFSRKIPMKLEDKHKEFFVKNYGKSMNASTFVNAIRG